MEQSIDEKIRRCGKLGSDVNFAYCRACGPEGLPCPKVFDCWWETFDVTARLKADMAPEDFEKLAALREKPKVHTLLELIARAQKNAEQS